MITCSDIFGGEVSVVLVLESSLGMYHINILFYRGMTCVKIFISYAIQNLASIFSAKTNGPIPYS
jgi:hypothetical protein